MAFFDKINDLAKTATEKTNSAIEITKLSAKIETENHRMNDIIRKIGEHFVAKMDSGETLDEEAMKIYAGVLECRKNIASLSAEKEALKAPKSENPAEG